MISTTPPPTTAFELEPTKKILVVGLKCGAGPTILANAWSAERVLEVVNSQIALGKMNGFDMINFPVDITRPRALILEELRDVLATGSWDGVSIGYGIRGKEELTLLFEGMVNIILEKVEPSPKLVFSLRPSNIWDAIKRQYGISIDAEAQPRRHTVA